MGLLLSYPIATIEGFEAIILVVTYSNSDDVMNINIANLLNVCFGIFTFAL